MRSLPLAGASALALLALSLAACTRGPAPTPNAQPTPVKQVAVNAAPVKRADIASTLTYTGDVKSQATLNVVPKVTGRIEKLLVDVGGTVKQGDVIAELDREQATLTVRQAEAAVAVAKARLATLQAGARPEAVAQADANARAARARVEALQQSSKPEVIAQAQAGVDAARQRVESLKNPRAESIAAADDNVKAAQARLDALKKGPTPEQIRAAELAVEQARNNLYSVQTQKDGACRTNGFACDAAQKQAFAMEDAVKIAQQQLKIVTAPPTAEALAQVQAQVDQAQAQANLARQPSSDQDIAQAENGIKSAEAQLSLARSPILASDVAAAIAQAEAAEAAARLAAKPYTQQDLDGAQAQVDQAQAQLDLARAQVKELTVTAPVSGVVADRFLVIGSVASPTTPIVSVAATATEITFNVEESQLGRLQPGQTAQIALPAYPGEPIRGKVVLVAPTIDQKSRTGQVKIIPDADQLGKLKPGMFAQVSVEAARKTNALVIPRSALLPGSPAQVFAVENGTVKKVAVETGLQDRDQIEVTSGLKDGDQVVVDAIDLREGDRVAVAALR